MQRTVIAVFGFVVASIVASALSRGAGNAEKPAVHLVDVLRPLQTLIGRFDATMTELDTDGKMTRQATGDIVCEPVALGHAISMRKTNGTPGTPEFYSDLMVFRSDKDAGAIVACLFSPLWDRVGQLTVKSHANGVLQIGYDGSNVEERIALGDRVIRWEIGRVTDDGTFTPFRRIEAKRR